MLTILSSVAGLVYLICAIYVLIKIFQDGKILMGILGIVTCGIVAFVYGWMNVARYNIRNIMIAWSVAWAISLVLTPFSFHVTTSATTPNGTVTHTTATP